MSFKMTLIDIVNYDTVAEKCLIRISGQKIIRQNNTTIDQESPFTKVYINSAITVLHRNIAGT